MCDWIKERQSTFAKNGVYVEIIPNGTIYGWRKSDDKTITRFAVSKTHARAIIKKMLNPDSEIWR